MLVLNGIGRAFGGVQALSDVNFTIDRGARHVIFGPNGAGKTTLFRVISGEVRPTAGRVLLDGVDITTMHPAKGVRLGMGRTFQVTSLFTDLTVEENAVLAAQATERSRFRAWRSRRSASSARARALRHLEERGLSHRARDQAGQLPYGEQRILEIVLALVGEPRVLLLDEPAAGMPPGDASQVMDHVRDLPDDIAVVLIEHDLDLAFRFSRTATVLSEGKVIADGTIEDVRANPAVQELYLGTSHE